MYSIYIYIYTSMYIYTVPEIEHVDREIFKIKSGL